MLKGGDFMSRRKSIFELERRSDLHSDYLKLIANLKATLIQTKSKGEKILYRFLDECIQDWPYRQASSSMNEYLSNLGVERQGDEITDTIFALELLFNLLKWAPTYDSNFSNTFSALVWECDVRQVCDRFIENIIFILEQNNMAVRESGKGALLQFRIYKRRVEVDAALEYAPSIAEVLLSYYDIRNERDEDYKKNTIKYLADYLEPKRDEFKGTIYKNLSDDVFFVFNRCNIRHNRTDQIKLKKSERMKLYDETFRMCLILIQNSAVAEYRNKINILKNSEH